MGMVIGSLLEEQFVTPDLDAEGSERALSAEDLKRRRYRLNQLINGRLRDTFDM